MWLVAAFGMTVFYVALFSSGSIGLDDELSPRSSLYPHFDARPAVLVAQLLCAVFFALAAAGFTGRAEHTGDELMRWFAIAAVLASFARVQYALFPSLQPQWVYTGDFFRLGFYVLLLVGSAREISSYWSSRAELARTEERRRLAREFHDGLAQELAFIATETRRHLDRPGRLPLERINSAAERALDEARWAVAALTRRGDEPLAQTLAAALEQIAARSCARVRCELDPSGPELACSGVATEHLVRIVREAATNALRHGGARTLTFALAADAARVRITLSDDGGGFDRARATSGFGLTSMRERAEKLGGRLTLRSRPGEGTTVEVELPWPVAPVS